ncbi:tRNA(m5U54)methyltransferase [Entophlyctis luteolus]|nr:tRNA(m5U54)methyltransferase [Entophlyctis luteolus]
MQKLKGGNETPKKIPLHVAFSQVPTVSAQQYPPANFIARPVTSTKANLMDIVNGHVMQSPSNSFYQLNSHLLPHLCQYISSELAPFTAASNRPVSTLVDAYCGTGIFALTQSHLFKHVIGIESDKDAIAFAKVNATENGINNARFVSGKVEDMFSGVETILQDMQAADSSRSSPTPTGDNLALVIDPPKKGCGEGFLAQVMRLQPRVIIYISCNPASQAQDLAILESFAKNGVPPASFHGSLGAIVSRGVITAAELRRVPRSHADADASMPRALYVGGKRIVLRDAPHTAGDSQVAVHVEDLDGSHAVSVAATSPSVSEPASAGLASTHSNTQIAASRVGPTTLLKFNGYSVTRIKPFDMFPQSFRSEVVTTLVRRDFVPANAMMMRQ